MYRLGVARAARELTSRLSTRARRERAWNRADIEKIGQVELASVRRQMQEEYAHTHGVALLISVDGMANVLLQLPVIAGLVAYGLEPVMLLPSSASREQRFLYQQIGIRRFAYWDEAGECKDFSSTLHELEGCRTQDDLLQLRWKSIHVGKFAVSTLMRRLRSGSIDPLEPGLSDQLAVTVRRTIDHAHAALALLDHWRPEAVVFIDRGYTPEGPMFEACIQRGIRPATMNSAHRDNALILKRYGSENANVHPVSLSDSTWARLVSMPWTDAHWERVRGEIEHCYRTGQWYGEVATQFNTKMLDRDSLRAELGIDPAKRTVLLFPHIFWDATFFWGEDVFQDYEEWFRETVRVAWHTPSVNWIIKIHPANVVKNIRDGSNSEFSELTVLKEFGEVPSHIHILPADTGISTLSLYAIGDVCLTVRGTVGIEAAAFGLSVVTAGTGRYDRLGFTLDADSPEAYRQLLENIAELSSPSPAQTELARRYAYGAFLIRPLETRSVHFAYVKSREASLDVSISDEAQRDLFGCQDILVIKAWLDAGDQDTGIQN